MNAEREYMIISAELESIELKQRSSLNVGTYSDAYFRRSWHYHPEFELLLITKGYGTRMTGDNFEKFSEGDLVLLGGNLPHAWISDPHFLDDNNKNICESVFIQFRKSVFGTHFIDMPEMESIRNILQKAERGLKIEGCYKDEISKQMLSLKDQSPLEQLLTLIRILDLVHRTEFRTLASNNYSQRGIFKSEKMTRTHNYLMQNFKHEVNVNTCAEHVGMTSSSFCRFFKKQTELTFSGYLNYLRINFAQQLLQNTELPIKAIAYDCGYNSVVYFNQKFKKITGSSPTQFREYR